MDFGLSVLLTTGSGFETGAKWCGRGCGSGPGTEAPACAPRHATAERGSATFAANPQSACPPVLSGKALDLGHPTVPASVGSPRQGAVYEHARNGREVSEPVLERTTAVKIDHGEFDEFIRNGPDVQGARVSKSCGSVPSASRAMQHGRGQEALACHGRRMAKDGRGRRCVARSRITWNGKARGIVGTRPLTSVRPRYLRPPVISQPVADAPNQGSVPSQRLRGPFRSHTPCIDA